MTRRLSTKGCTQFVATLCDLETLLLQMAAGHMPPHAYVIPIQNNVDVNSAVWKLFQGVLGSNNCHEVSWPRP